MPEFKCGHAKSEDNVTPDGRCRTCRNARQSERRRANPSRYSRPSTEDPAKHRARSLARYHRLMADPETREQVKQYKREWWAAQPEEKKEAKREQVRRLRAASKAEVSP
jgi:hypothetical protein